MQRILGATFIKPLIVVVIMVALALLVWLVYSSNKPDVQVYGLVKTTGLSEDEKKSNGLQYSDYQLTNFKWLDASENLKANYIFIEAAQVDNEQQKLYMPINTCVLVEGKSVKDDNGDVKYVGFGNDVMIVKPIKTTVVNSDLCAADSVAGDWGVEPKVTITGKVENMTRPGYDIFYDYSLEVDNPNAEYGFTGYTEAGETPAEQIVLVLHSSVPGSLNDYVGENVEVEGYATWGYAESKFLYVTKITKL